MPENYTYLYPNQKSYANLPVNKQHGNFHWQGRSLRHGYIYGYKKSALAGSFLGNAIADTMGPAFSGVNRQIDFSNVKMFQFNPPAMTMNTTLMPTESADVAAAGGNDPTNGVGYASSRLELYFDRTIEVARSNNGTGSEVWRDIGVQMDLYELLKVISGGDTSDLAVYDPDTNTGEGWGSVRAGSMNHLTGKMFDATVAGSQLMFKSFAVVFNPNLAIHVRTMTSFAFTYLQFTSDLVPTVLKVEMDLEIVNMGSRGYVTSGGTAGATSSTPTTGTTSGTAPPPNVRTGPPPGGLQADRQF